MTDDPPLIRQWKLLRMLSARRLGLTVRAMADECGVSVKTIRRDLDQFLALGFPIEQLVGDRGRKTWRINAAWSQPPLDFAYDEALALYIGRRLMEPLAGTHVGEAARSAFDKIRTSLGDVALAYLDHAGSLFHQTTVGAGDYTDRAELLDSLMLAYEEAQVAWITYQSQHATEPATRAVHPYGLAAHRGSLYLIAFAPEHQQIRHYKVDRISAVTVGPDAFERPEGFDVAAHLAGTFGIYHGDQEVTVRIRFLPPAARYVLESRWHPTQQLARQPDGSLLAEFRLSSTTEIKSWVLSFGAQAVVIEPKSLRREIAEELRSLALAYASDIDPGEPVDNAEPTTVRPPPRRRS